MFGEDGGSTEFGWRRWRVRDKGNQNKGVTKGENDKIGMIQGKSEVSEKGQRGRPEQDLTPGKVHMNDSFPSPTAKC